MSNAPGYASVEDSVPELITPNIGTNETTAIQNLNVSNSYLHFKEHMYGTFDEKNEPIELDIQFVIPATNIFDFLAWSINIRRCEVIGRIIIGDQIYTIQHGDANLYPFSGSYTSSVFFQYRLVLQRDGKQYYFYGEKIARPWSLERGILTNIWRIWENVSQQHCFLFELKGTKTTFVGKSILAIKLLEYPSDQVFGIRTPRTWFIFYLLVVALWFFILTFNIVRTHINSNARELTNYWTSYSGSFKPKAKEYWNWDKSVTVPLDGKSHFFQPHNVKEVSAAIEFVRAHGPNASLRLVGSGHSFNVDILNPSIADSSSPSPAQPKSGLYMLELSNMRRILELNLAARWVEVEGGVQLRRLVEVLHDHGFTLLNHGAYLVQTVAGALSTGTHGTSGGWKKDVKGQLVPTSGSGSLLDAVLGGEFITEKGPVAVTPFNIVTAGLLGVLVRVRLIIVPIAENYFKQNQIWTPRSECLNYDFLAEKLTDPRYSFLEVRGPTGAASASVYLYEKVDYISWVQSIYNVFLRFGLMLFYDAASIRLPIWFYRFSYAGLTRYLGFFPQIDVNSWVITKDYAPPHEETEWAIPFERESVTSALAVLEDIVNNGDANAQSLLGEFHIRFDLPTKPWIAPSNDRFTMYIDLNYPHSNKKSKIDKIYDQWQPALQGRVPKARPHWSKRYHIETALPTFQNYTFLNDFKKYLATSADSSAIFLNNKFARATGLAPKTLAR